MSFFRSFGRRGRVREAVRELETSRLRARTILDKVAVDDRPAVVVEGLKALLFDDRDDRARELAEASSDLANAEAQAAVSEALERLGLLSAAIVAAERVVGLAPENGVHVATLGRLLVDDGRAAQALELFEVASLDSAEIELERGRALFATGKTREGLALVDACIPKMELLLRSSFRETSGAFLSAYERAQAIRDGMRRELHGAESVIDPHVAERRLVGSSGHNYRLLAERAMTTSTYEPIELRLIHPEEELAKLPALRDCTSPVLHARRGSAEHRLGQFDRARRSFEAALEIAPGHFPAMRGMAGLLDEREFGLFRAVAKLPRFDVPRDIDRIVPDFHALTERERSVVLLSLEPLRVLVPALIESRAAIRILPVDVRTVDLPEWASARGERFDDARSMDALGGVADSHAMLAASRIEDLLDIVSPHAFVFAHELAHLAFYVMEDDGPIIELYERALDNPHTVIGYQLENEHEFFAVAYEHYLRATWGSLPQREDDDIGLFRDVTAFFDGLSR